MEINITKGDGAINLDFHGEMTIYDAQQCKNVLLEALKQCEVVSLDLSDVSEIDTAGVQILTSLVQSAKKMDREVFISESGQAFGAVIHLCNLGSDLGLTSD
jgi:anti-anti-sigma factor